MRFLMSVAAGYLKKQKRHTVLTEIGIVLSVMLMTVILVSVSTVVATFANISAYTNGSYHVIFNDLTKDQLITISNMDIFESSNKYGISMYTDNTGLGQYYDQVRYLSTSDGELVSDTFLRLDKNGYELLPENLKSLSEGRLPETENEIVLSEADKVIYGYPVIGSRIYFVRFDCSVGDPLRDHTSDEWYQRLEGTGYEWSVPQSIDDTYDITGAELIEYTVCGFGEEYSIISYSDAKMKSALPENDKLLLTYGPEQYDFYWDMHYAFADCGLEIDNFDYGFNQEYLNMINAGVTAKSYNTIMYMLVYLAVFFIMFCVRMVIDNSFEISSHERIKQFGVLRAVGASKKQILGILISEALLLSAIGVPIGIAAGTAAGYGMFRVISRINAINTLSKAYSMSEMLEFSIDPSSFVIAAVFGVLWVVVSAVGTGMRVNKIPPVEAVRHSGSKVKLRSREKKLSADKLGVELLIAFRSIRRNYKRYVITLVSMTLSIVIYAGFSYALEIVSDRVKSIYSEANSPWDYTVTSNDLLHEKAPESAKEMKETGLFKNVQYDSYIQFVAESDENTNGNEKISGYYYMSLHPVNESTYKKLTGLDDYADFAASESIILSNTIHGEDKEYQLYSEIPPSVKANAVVNFITYEGYSFDISGSYDTEMSLYRSTPLSIVACIAEPAYEKLVKMYGGDSSVSEQEQSDGTIGLVYSRKIYADAVDGKYDEAAAWLERRHYGMYADNYTEGQILNALLSVIKIGGYFAVLLLTLIAVVNIANIISTNVLNRTAEIGMMRACGMSSAQITKMVVYESFIYAGCSALISVIVIEGIIALIYVPFKYSGGWATVEDMIFKPSFVEPLKYLGIASVLAFAVAAVSAIPAARRIIKTPIVDAIEEAE